MGSLQQQATPDAGSKGPTVPQRADLGPRILTAVGWAVFGLVAIDHVGDGPIRSLDAPIARLVPHEGPLHAASRLATHLGDQVVLVAFTLLGIAVLLRNRAHLDAAVLGIAKAVTAALVVGLKHLFGRPRPFAGPAEGACCAFPSGHATEAAMVFMLLAVLLFDVRDEIRPWAEGVAIGIALVVGASRIVLNVHWFTDVLAGWGLGWGLAGAFLLLRIYLERKKVLPNLAPREGVPNGVGLGLTERIDVQDEARVLADLEDVPEHRPAPSITDPLHPEQERVPVEGLVAREHRTPVERGRS